jgi:hypothetical protein
MNPVREPAAYVLIIVVNVTKNPIIVACIIIISI